MTDKHTISGDVFTYLCKNPAVLNQLITNILIGEDNPLANMDNYLTEMKLDKKQFASLLPAIMRNKQITGNIHTGMLEIVGADLPKAIEALQQETSASRIKPRL